MTLRWYEGSATATTRTIVAEICKSVEYHLVIGQTLSTLVRVGDQNTALACGEPDEMRTRAEEFAAAEERPRIAAAKEQPRIAVQRHVFEPPDPEPATLSAADMINDLPNTDQIAIEVDKMITT